MLPVILPVVTYGTSRASSSQATVAGKGGMGSPGAVDGDSARAPGVITQETERTRSASLR
jgi:hypothetical protein